MPIYEVNEKVLEIINLIIFLRLKNIRENKDMNEEIEEDLKEKKTYEKIYQQKEELENFSYLYNALLDKTIFNRITLPLIMNLVLSSPSAGQTSRWTSPNWPAPPDCFLWRYCAQATLVMVSR